MKRSIFIICFFLLSFTEGNIKNDLARDHLKGKVKTITKFTNTTVKKYGKWKTITKYNIKGNRTEEIMLAAPDDFVFSKHIYKYSSDDNTCEEDAIESDGSIDSKQIRKYDRKRNVILEDNYIDGKLNNKTIYKYDDNGNNYEEDFYEIDGSMGTKQIYKYDESGNRVEWVSYLKDGSVYFKSTSKFDVWGNEIESKTINADGSIRDSSKNIWKCDKFDKTGNWLEATIGKDKVVRIIEYYKIK